MLLKSFATRVACLIAVGSLGVQAQATGLMSCDVPRDDWGSKTELRTRLSAEGWVVRKVKVDEGCYEVYGTTPEGERVEAYFDPATFEKLLVARRGEILFRKQAE